MTHYEAVVTREGKWWMVHIPALDGLTQARRLSEAELMAREFISLTTDVPIGEVSVDVILEQIGSVSGIRNRLDRINAERREASELEERARADAADLARALARENVPLRDVGTVLNISHQRAHQLLHD